MPYRADPIDKRILWIWDGQQLIHQHVDSDGAGSAPFQLKNRYLYANMVDMIFADELVGVPDPSANPSISLGGGVTSPPNQVLWPLTDHLGSVRAILDHSGQVVERRVYDSFGNRVLAQGGSGGGGGSSGPGGPGGTPGGSSGTTNSIAADHLFGYTGREWDSDIGLQYNRARWYDPKQGRWISQDPIGFAAGDENLYRYVGNGPTNATDPSGLEENPYLFLLSGNHTSGEALVYLHGWKDVLETNVHGNTRDARIAIKQLIPIVTALELREKQARREAAQPWFESATGVGVLKSLDRATGYIPFVHEGIDVIDGTSQNFVGGIPIVGFFASEVGAIDTSKYTGWAWEGQRFAFGVSTCSLELASGASLFRGIRFAPVRAPAAVHAGQAAAESTVASQASILRSLRATNTPESHAIAKLIKRGKVELQFLPTDPLKRGAAGAKPFGSNVIEIYSDVSSSARRAAGVTAHETKHWLQKLTPSTYRRVHEFEAYQFQRSAGYLNLTDDQIWKIINTHPAYKNVPR